MAGNLRFKLRRKLFKVELRWTWFQYGFSVFNSLPSSPNRRCLKISCQHQTSWALPAYNRSERTQAKKGPTLNKQRRIFFGAGLVGVLEASVCALKSQGYGGLSVRIHDGTHEDLRLCSPPGCRQLYGQSTCAWPFLMLRTF